MEWLEKLPGEPSVSRLMIPPRNLWVASWGDVFEVAWDTIGRAVWAAISGAFWGTVWGVVSDPVRGAIWKSIFGATWVQSGKPSAYLSGELSLELPRD